MPDISPIPDAWLAVLDRLVGGADPWMALPTLARWLAVPALADDAETVFAMVDASPAWLALWPLGPHEYAVTLTEWAAERCRVEIVEEGVADRPRWGRMDESLVASEDRTPGEVVYLPGWHLLPVAAPEVVSQKFDASPRWPEPIDPGPGPAELAAQREAERLAAEEAERRAKIAMRSDEVTHYDAEKDETTIETVESPLKLWEKEVPVDPKIKGKKGGGKAKAKGRRTA